MNAADLVAPATVRGWLTALDENSGKMVWRAYSTDPDKDLLIGDDFKPPQDWLKGKDLGVKTWPAGHRQRGGGTVWAGSPTIPSST